MDKRIPNSLIRRVWLDESLTSTEAARVAGLTRTNLWLRAKALGLPPRKAGRRMAVPRDATFVDMWQAGVLASEMAGHFGCHPMTICAVARDMGLARRPLGWRPRVTLADWLMSQQIDAMHALAAEENLALRKVMR